MVVKRRATSKRLSCKIFFSRPQESMSRNHGMFSDFVVFEYLSLFSTKNVVVLSYSATRFHFSLRVDLHRFAFGDGQ